MRRHPRLDARRAVRDLREVVPAELLLVLHAERAVVGRDRLEVVEPRGRATARSCFSFAPQRRAHDVLRAVEAGLLVVVVGEEEVLRAGLGVGGQAAVARRRDLVERLGGREVDDVDRARRRSRRARSRGGSPRPRARGGRVSAWYFGAVLPLASACSTSTSMTPPFSACMQIVAPISPERCSVRKIERVVHA